MISCMILHSSTASDTPMQCSSVSNGRIWRLPLQETFTCTCCFISRQCYLFSLLTHILMSNMPVSDTPMQCLRVSNGRIWRLPLHPLSLAWWSHQRVLPCCRVMLGISMTRPPLTCRYAVIAVLMESPKFALQFVQALLPLMTRSLCSSI